MAQELAPGFLVASPNLLDPNFARSLVLLVEHRSQGSLGFVVNRPARIDFASVVEELELLRPGLAPPELPVLVGGPVAPHTGWLLFDPNLAPLSLDGTIEVTRRLRVSASRELLREMAGSREARRRQLVLGYAGWGAGQLDEEIRQGAWIPVDLDEQIIFETPFQNRWTAALAAAGIDPMFLVGAVPEA